MYVRTVVVVFAFRPKKRVFFFAFVFSAWDTFIVAPRMRGWGSSCLARGGYMLLSSHALRNGDWNYM